MDRCRVELGVGTGVEVYWTGTGVRTSVEMWTVLSVGSNWCLWRVVKVGRAMEGRGRFVQGVCGNK